MRPFSFPLRHRKAASEFSICQDRLPVAQAVIPGSVTVATPAYGCGRAWPESPLTSNADTSTASKSDPRTRL